MHGLIGFAKELAALGVADDDGPTTGLDQHARGDLSGEGAFPLPVKVLRRNCDGRAARRFDRGSQSRKRWSDDDVAMLGGSDER